ncbi:hypothetical protein TD95_001461 [Thielaviopsis punctulata]|uniref:RhoGAP-domain-containing protein n=1 Tax=Thielaviopsis punctulata TaxID=72032 RepID=A0A0F4ZAL8_9PEZI|nr:hypothetical protein TD95_001461 [Thielaviopsis punctulata]
MAATIMDEYLDAGLEHEQEEIYPCKRCGEILEEGKAFELAGYRWHLDCFRCHTCNTLLDSDTNLLLLGDGSLICSNCTYSCSACNNKIEDLAILTGDQAFCATCFRCRNCKRKIENLRYARTSTGIFCMSCHESLTARRKKRAKAQAAKSREKEIASSPMITEKSLPALPPTIENRRDHDHQDIDNDHDHGHGHDMDPATELSPRPRQNYGGGVGDSLGSPDRSNESPGGNKNEILLPTQYRGNNRTSTIGAGDSVDLDSFLIPMALEETPTRPATSSAPAPHIFFQEKGRMPSITSDPLLPDGGSRKMSKSGRNDSAASYLDDSTYQSPSSRTSPDEFKLQEAPKSKKTSSPVSQNNDSGFGTITKSSSSSSRTSYYAPSGANGTPKVPQGDSQGDHMPKAIARKEVGSSNNRSTSSSISRSSSDNNPYRSTDYDDSTSTSTPKLSQTYTKPRPAPAPPVQAVRELSSSALPVTPAPPNPPPAPPVPGGSMRSGQAQASNSNTTSPKLPRWSSGAEFTLDEDMARIMGNEDGSSSILRRVSNAVRHGRTNSTESSSMSPGSTRPSHTRSISETARGASSTSPTSTWPKTPTKESHGLGRDIISPISNLMSPQDDNALLKRQLRSSELRVAELERQADTERNLQTLTQKLMEKRKTVSELDAQTEIMIRQIEVLAGYVERAKQTNKPLDIHELEESAIKEFVERLEQVKRSMAEQIQKLYSERSVLFEERDAAVSKRDQALMEFEQLSDKNSQLTDMNNELTNQIQGRFKSHANVNTDPKSPNGNSLGIYGGSKYSDGGSSIHTGTTLLGGDHEEPIVESGPMVVNIRKGQVKKFNWKKGSKTLAQNVGKGVSKAAAAFQTDKERAAAAAGQGGYLAGDNIGLPYNMTVAQAEAPVMVIPPSNGRRDKDKDNHLDQQRQGFGFFKKSGQPGAGGNGNGNNMQLPKSMSANNISTPAVAEAPSTLFGSDLTERADYERRQIPWVVTRCIQEVELRGMDVEGIYRKTGGNSQVKMVQDGFDKDENYDISDPSIDITAVTSVLKQYFRKLPTPLLSFDIYDKVLESNALSNNVERCAHLSATFGLMPEHHQDTLEFLMFHLSRVAKREPENLMSPKNLAVVFAPTIMRDTSIEREMTDMHAKNIAVQFVIENSETIFSK